MRIRNIMQARPRQINTSRMIDLNPDMSVSVIYETGLNSSVIRDTSWAPVAYVCNPCYSGGRVQED
jgi:hypothetical protein